jgi:glucokinase
MRTLHTSAPAAYVVGIDLGGTKVSAVLEDAGATCLARHVWPTRTSRAELEDDLALAVRRLAADAGVAAADIAAIGLGVPGAVDDGVIALVPNVLGLADPAIVGALAERLGAPLVIDNDVNLATLAEGRKGAAAGVRDFVFIAVGTGLGMGLMLGGAIYRGSRGAAGEIAYMPLGADPFSTANQRRGALEEVAGGLALGRRYTERTGAAEPVSARQVFARLGGGDAVAAAVVDEAARAVALAVQGIRSVLDPELVVFGGGIGVRGPFLARVRAHARSLSALELPIHASALGPGAGVLGAALLARDAVPAMASR